MADIEIEKKRSNIWPWIIAILIILALLWAFARHRNNNAARGYGDTTAIQGTTPAPATGTASSTQP